MSINLSFIINIINNKIKVIEGDDPINTMDDLGRVERLIALNEVKLEILEAFEGVMQ